MPLDELAEKDFEILLEAVEAWESAPVDRSFMPAILAGMIGGGKGESMADKHMQQGQDKARARKGIAIILKAKLELARQAAQAAAIEKAGGAH